MAVDERSRHALYGRLEEVLGVQDATVLMEHLPPAGWADVVTHRDLDVAVTKLDARLDRFESMMQTGLAELRADIYLEMTRQTRTIIIALVSVVVSLSSLMLGVLALT